MSFPNDPLDVTVELLLGGTWTDLTDLIYARDNLIITRGRSSEGTRRVERSTCRSTANNATGDLSPRKPTGAYYGKIGRNTRYRVRITPASAGYLLMGDPDRASTPDSANLSITGDIDIRVDIQPADPTKAAGLANKNVNPSQRSWALYLNADGTLGFAWTADGSTPITKTSTAAVSFPDSGRKAVRVTLDVNNGAGGNDVTFYTADSISGSWSQLGAVITTAGVTSIFDSTAAVEIGGSQGVGSADDLVGRVYAFQLYQGIAGTLRADVDLDDEEAGAASFVDGSGNTWTLISDASIVDPAICFQGEVSEWPVRWDPSGNDVWVPMEASGILRRLEQGASPLKSALYRAYTSLATQPLAYWPCEDADGSTELASALGGPPMVVSGTPTLASNTDFKCSEPLPVLSSSEWTGVVPGYTSTGALQVWMLISIPSGGASNGQGIFSLYTQGTVRRWSLIYATTGDLSLKGYDADNVEVEDSGNIDFNLDGSPQRISVSLQQNGADVDYEIRGQRLDGGVGGLGGTFTSQTLGRATRVIVNPGGGLGDVGFGHVSVHDEIRSPFDLVDEFIAYSGEVAGRRIQRLCGEEGVAFRTLGDLDSTTPMGAQLPKTLVDLLQEAADADQGLLYEPRDIFGLAYRPRESLYNQPAALELDYDAGHIARDGIEPVDDDQQTRNDITVQRDGGSSFRVVKESGALSILPPPDGVGRYDDQVTSSLEGDGLLPDAAGWLLHLGTVDEARYPKLVLNLAADAYASDQALTLAAQDLDIGGRLTVTNLPAWLPPDDLSQLALGFVEVMHPKAHRIEVNCAPESPWGQAVRYDDGVSRYSSDGSTLAEDLTTTETDVDVATPSGPLWSHADGDFDIRVGGEVMTVTNVTGSSSPQTFTVTRSVNGVVKSHLTGAEVALDHPRVYVP